MTTPGIPVSLGAELTQNELEHGISADRHLSGYTGPIDDKNRPPYRDHIGEGGQYMRDFILGVNDGLVTSLLLVVGVAASGLTNRDVLLTGIAGAVAGAISMGLGEYIATKSQGEVQEREMKLEKEHFLHHRDQELDQVRHYFKELGISPGPLLENIVTAVNDKDEALMKVMAAFEFSCDSADNNRNPLVAMFYSGRLFFLGSFPSVIPFAIFTTPTTALLVAIACAFATLFFVGAYKTKTTKGNWVRDGSENLAIGMFATGVTYALGLAFAKI